MGRGKRRAGATAVRPRAKGPLTPKLLLEAARGVVGELNESYGGGRLTKTSATAIEQRLHEYLGRRYIVDRGNAASGADLPALGYDIKVTSMRKPQSSAPYRGISEKIFGLPYGILVLPYSDSRGRVTFGEPVLLRPEETADRRLTAQLNEMKKQGVGWGQFIGFLRAITPDVEPVELERLASRIVDEEIPSGRVGLSDARQWRVRYGEAIREAHAADPAVPAAA
jgi:hypothetical protein